MKLIEQLEALLGPELERVLADAARYRWLRDKADWAVGPWEGPPESPEVALIDRESLDQAIDKARGEA